MNILKSLFLIIGLLSLATLTTNAYFSDQITVTGNEFSTGAWLPPSDTVRICHATGQEGQYQPISLSTQGIINGHVGVSHQNGQDIIPPFDYGDPVQHFIGQNWDDAGQAIYNNNCEAASASPLLSV